MLELRKKRREIKRISKIYDKKIEEAQNNKESEGDVAYLVHEMFEKTDAIEEEIRIYISDNWRQRAEKLYLPVPEVTDEQYWQVGNFTHIYHLKPNGISYIRSLIREETSARRKALLEWTHL